MRSAASACKVARSKALVTISRHIASCVAQVRNREEERDETEPKVKPTHDPVPPSVLAA